MKIKVVEKWKSKNRREEEGPSHGQEREWDLQTLTLCTQRRQNQKTRPCSKVERIERDKKKREAKVGCRDCVGCVNFFFRIVVMFCVVRVHHCHYHHFATIISFYHPHVCHLTLGLFFLFFFCLFKWNEGTRRTNTIDERSYIFFQVLIRLQSVCSLQGMTACGRVGLAFNSRPKR